MQIKIEWLEDSNECDTCGYNYAEGAKVFFDEELVIDLEPAADCFGGRTYDDVFVFRQILEKLGHTVEQSHG